MQLFYKWTVERLRSKSINLLYVFKTAAMLQTMYKSATKKSSSWLIFDYHKAATITG